MLDLVDRHLEDLDAVLDPRRRQRLVAGAGERRALAVEEPLDDRQSCRVVVGRRGDPDGAAEAAGSWLACSSEGAADAGAGRALAAAGALDDFGG